MCEAAGLGFEPIVFESTGGLESEARVVINSLIAMYSEAVGKPFYVAKETLVQRISLILIRSHHRALTRRRGEGHGGEGLACMRAVGVSEVLESPGGMDQ